MQFDSGMRWEPLNHRQDNAMGQEACNQEFTQSHLTAVVPEQGGNHAQHQSAVPAIDPEETRLSSHNKDTNETLPSISAVAETQEEIDISPSTSIAFTQITHDATGDDGSAESNHSEQRRIQESQDRAKRTIILGALPEEIEELRNTIRQYASISSLSTSGNEDFSFIRPASYENQ